MSNQQSRLRCQSRACPTSLRSGVIHAAAVAGLHLRVRDAAALHAGGPSLAGLRLDHVPLLAAAEADGRVRAVQGQRPISLQGIPAKRTAGVFIQRGTEEHTHNSVCVLFLPALRHAGLQGATMLEECNNADTPKVWPVRAFVRKLRAIPRLVVVQEVPCWSLLAAQDDCCDGSVSL